VRCKDRAMRVCEREVCAWDGALPRVDRMIALSPYGMFGCASE